MVGQPATQQVLGLDNTIAVDSPGLQIVQFSGKLDYIGRTRGFSLPFTAEAPVLVTASPEEAVDGVSDPELDAIVQASLERANVWWNGRENYLRATVDFASVPVPLALGVYIRIGGREFPPSNLIVYPDGHEEWLDRATTMLPSFPPGPIDIVLCPERRVALLTLDLDCMWDGAEIVIPGVEVGE